MALEKPINVRLSAEHKLKYETEAAKLDMPVGAYLRQQLKANSNIFEEISALKRAIQHVAVSLENGSNENSNEDKSVMLETLLLLRQISQPQKVNLAQQELKRLGFTVWNAKTQMKRDKE